MAIRLPHTSLPAQKCPSVHVNRGSCLFDRHSLTPPLCPELFLQSLRLRPWLVAKECDYGRIIGKHGMLITRLPVQHTGMTDTHRQGSINLAYRDCDEIFFAWEEVSSPVGACRHLLSRWLPPDDFPRRALPQLVGYGALFPQGLARCACQDAARH